jgi:hypothetical protein
LLLVTSVLRGVDMLLLLLLLVEQGLHGLLHVRLQLSG